MCRKIKKLAWGTNDEDPLEQKLDYRFLELLVLYESKSNISERIKKAGMTTEKYSDYFLDQLRPLLQTPNKYLATYLKKTFHPGLKDETMKPEMADFYMDVQKRIEIPLRMKPVPPRAQSAPMPRDEAWTVVTPVPHIRCPCNPQRTYSPVVTKEERRAVEIQKTDICYQLQTGRIRRERELQCSLEHFLPSYQKVAVRESPPPRPSSVPSVQDAVSTKDVPRGASVFERLSTPRKRLPIHFPCYASARDACKKGIATKEGLGETQRATSKWTRKLQRRRAIGHTEASSDFIRLC